MKRHLSISAIVFITATGFAQTTYNDVAKIFFKRCTSCHHKDGGAPFPMMNYAETVSHAAAIKTDVSSGKMPPMFTDTTFSRFLRERLVTASEKAAIIKWVDDGALQGDPALAPQAPVYTKYKIAAKPDLIVKVPPFSSNADTEDKYNCFAIPTTLTTTRIIRAFEIVPNNPSIVHHVVVNVDTVGNVKSQLDGACYMQPGERGLGTYTPGCGPTVFPNHPSLKMGMTLKKGWQIIAQNHYPPGSSKQIDSTEIRFYFYPEGTTGVREVSAGTPIQTWTMYLLPNTVSTYKGSWLVNKDISIFGSYPHAHSVNRSMRINAYKPGTADSINLIHIPNWDFNWEGVYHHKRLVKIPSGYTVLGKHVYDNTTNNKKNPNNPPKLVVAGPKTADEMLFDSFEWMNYQPGDENLDLEEILENDPLLSVNEETLADAKTIHSCVFPNPATAATTLVVKNTLAEKCELKWHDINGKQVTVKTTRNADSFFITRGNLPAGVYFYTLTSGHYSGSGKIVFMPQAEN